MTNKIFITGRHDAREVAEENKYQFIRLVLFNLGIPEEEIEPCLPETSKEFNLNHKIYLRNVLKKFDLNVVDDGDGGIKIYLENTKIAEWKKCKFVMKEDLSTIEPSERIYMEVHAEFYLPGEE